MPIPFAILIWFNAVFGPSPPTTPDPR